MILVRIHVVYNDTWYLLSITTRSQKPASSCSTLDLFSTPTGSTNGSFSGFFTARPASAKKFRCKF
jgi:hypothetical protein